MAGSFALSLAAVDVLGQTLDVNVRQFPFEIPSVGMYVEDRRRIATAVFVDLAKRNLIRQGDLVPDLERALRALSDYQVAVAAMGIVELGDGKPGKKIFARASAIGDTGVLAVQDGQQLRFELIRPTALAMSIVGLLPKADAGPGQSVTVTQPAGARRQGEDGGYFQGVHGPRGSDPAMRLAEGYLRHKRTGSGFFVVSARDRNGREIRAGEVSWFDTEVGRYLTLARPAGDDGRMHGTFSPADGPRLTQQLGQLIQSAAPRA